MAGRQSSQSVVAPCRECACAKEKPQKGVVIAVGSGKVTDDGKHQPMDVKVGDTILFDKYSGSKIKMDNEEYLIIREEDILGIIEN